jgi:hypothetical protein
VVEDETTLTDVGVGSTRVIEEPKSSSRQHKHNYISHVYIFWDFNYLNVVLLSILDSFCMYECFFIFAFVGLHVIIKCKNMLSLIIVDFYGFF